MGVLHGPGRVLGRAAHQQLDGGLQERTELGPENGEAGARDRTGHTWQGKSEIDASTQPPHSCLLCLPLASRSAFGLFFYLSVFVEVR